MEMSGGQNGINPSEMECGLSSKQRGGLKLLHLQSWNDVALIKLINDILSESNSLCVAWAAKNKLKGKSFWEVEEKKYRFSFVEAPFVLAQCTFQPFYTQAER